ncbi:MAG: type 1 glutamine amidotransferase domain-containing protein [Nannocystaceae bacterium]
MNPLRALARLGRRPALPAPGDPSIARAVGRVVAIPIGHRDFDPTEVAIPWQVLRARGVRCVFATPDGAPGRCDPRMLDGEGLGPLAGLLRADARARSAYAALEADPAFARPLAHEAVVDAGYDAILLPGGHAPGMRAYLESRAVQSLVVDAFTRGRIVAAICHGVLVAARARIGDRSALHGKRTTALLRRQELLAWRLTRRRVGDYYRTYPTPVEDEVRAALADPGDFVRGPTPIARDREEDLSPGFVVIDGRYLSARWPGDAHRLAGALLGALASETA